MRKGAVKPCDPDKENQQFIKDIIREIRDTRVYIADKLYDYHRDMEILDKITGVTEQEKMKLISDRVSKKNNINWDAFQMLQSRVLKRWEKHLARLEANKKPPSNKLGG